MNEEKLFKQICERCENHATNMVCEDMDTCPAYNLYLIAKSKREVVYKRDDWQTPPTPKAEMIESKIYNYLLETMYSLPSCSTCQYNHTSHLKRLPCNKCEEWSKYKLHKGHKADLERMARGIINIV